jgi:cbb3-type cytochrome oxidase subunit 3
MRSLFIALLMVIALAVVVVIFLAGVYWAYTP